MGRLRSPERVELITGLLASDTVYFHKAEKLLERHFGKIEYRSAPIPFTQSDYYAEEMGAGIIRKFISFERLQRLDDIYKIKLISNRLEQKLSSNGKRNINIDPGYLDMAKLILLTTKDYSHRIYLRGSIYAETTLHFQAGTFKPWPWTYRDYQTNEYLDIFNNIRQIYKTKMEKICRSKRKA